MNLKRFCTLGGALFVLAMVYMFAFHQDATAQYITKVYHKIGGAELVVASAGQITVESGGEIEIESGGRLEVESGGCFIMDGDTLFIVRAEGNVASGDSIIMVPVSGCDSSDMAIVTLNSAVIGKVMWAFPRVDTVDVMIDMNPSDTVSISVQVWKD